jgi:ankyrin repeat protein
VIDRDSRRRRYGFYFGFVVLLICPGVFAEAASPSRIEAISKLKASGIEVNATRLVQYAAAGDLVTVELLLAAGIPARSAEPVWQVTPLHNAAAQGHARLVARLLELGADVNARDARGYTALIDAAYGGRGVIVKQLLEAGARSDVRPTDGPTALIAAVQADSLAVVDQLLIAGADPALADASGQTPLIAADRAGRTAIAARLKSALGAAP